jgi:hypothetical protein
MKKVLKIGLIAALAIVGVNGEEPECPHGIKGYERINGAYWVDKDCTAHNSTTISKKKAKEYGIFYWDWQIKTKGKIDYVKTKIEIKRSNRCFYLKKGKNGWSRKEWKRKSDDTVEISMGDYCCKGAELTLIEAKDKEDLKKNYWNVFDMPLNCSEAPSFEWWTVKQKINGKWKVVGREKFIINP